MSDTPRTDANTYLPLGDDMIRSNKVGWVPAKLVREMEAELAEARQQANRLAGENEQLRKELDIERGAEATLFAIADARDRLQARLNMCDMARMDLKRELAAMTATKDEVAEALRKAKLFDELVEALSDGKSINPYEYKAVVVDVLARAKEVKG